MKLPEHLKPRGGRFNLTPMIDVVFLLIIFFIVSNNMIQQDSAVQIDLPEAETGTLPQEQQTKRLTVSILSPGTIYVGVERMDQENLHRLLTECRKDWGEESEIRIRTDKNVAYSEIKPILQMAAECGIINVSFAVTERV
jgi:biopolymer transport protein ExbD